MRYAVVVLLLACAIAACDDGGDSSEPSPRPLPSAVTVAAEPADGFTLGDPALVALPGATVETGRLFGANYQIEVPDDWNGRLVMYAHGNDQDVELQVYPPPNRRQLIADGYAWASSSYSVNVAVVTGVATDETAALWDYFAAKQGRPQYTYIMGDSMGGAVAFLSGERYPDRYDGSLPLCGDVDSYAVQGDFFVAAAYIAGVTQTEWDASDVVRVIDERLRPMLRDASQRQRFVALWADLSGGARTFVDEGVAMYQEQFWRYIVGNLVAGVYDNIGREYVLGVGAGVGSAAFNAGAIRITGTPGGDRYAETNRITGDIAIPTLSVHMTGDALTIFNQAREMHRVASDNGRGDLLVQRAIQSPLHCFDGGMTGTELDRSFADLVAWVERGEKPQGEDLTGDVRDAGERFTSVPRYGSTSASALESAGDRVSVTGTVTLNGEPVDEAFLWADVLTDGRRRACSYDRATIDRGRYSLTIAPATETDGCGALGSQIAITLFDDGDRYESAPVRWPDAGGPLTVDLALTDEDRASNSGTFIAGRLLGTGGDQPAAGTRVEAHIGNVLCGETSVPPVRLVFDDASGFGVVVASETLVAGCTNGAEVTLRVDGTPVTGRATNTLEFFPLDLAIP